MKQWKVVFSVCVCLGWAISASGGEETSASQKSPFWPDARRAAEVSSLKSSGRLARFSGAFLCISADKENWSDQQWSYEFDRLKELGLRELILAHVLAAPLTGQSRAFYPSKIEGFVPTKTDMVEKMLSEADKRGLKMHLGLVLDEGWWTGQNPRYIDSLTSRSIAAATETYGLYKHHPSLAGYYITNEIDNASWTSPERFDLLTKHFLVPVSDSIKSLDKNLIVSQAPFFNAAGMPYQLSPKEYGDFWRRVFRAVPNLDWLIPQDGIGVYHATQDQVTLYFSAIRDACRENGRAFWSDLETFDMKPKEGEWVAPIGRVASQLAAERLFVDGFVFWEYFSNMSPQVSNGGRELYLQYRHYLGGGKPLIPAENIAGFVSFSPDPTDTEPIEKQKSRMTDGEIGMVERLQVRWAVTDDPQPIAVTVELHSRFDSISDCRAYFLSDPDKNDMNPKSVRVEVSEDGEVFRAFGELKPVVPPMDNKKQVVMWTKPDTATTASAKFVRYIVEPLGPMSRVSCQEVQVLSDRAIVNPAKPASSVQPINLAAGMPYLLSAKPSEQYPDEGKLLTDNKVGTDYRSNVGWLNADKPFEITVDLKKANPVKRVDVAYFYSPSAGVYFPKSVEVSWSLDGQTFCEPKHMELEQNGQEENSYYQREADGAEARFVRITVNPEKDGKNEWLMLGEIFVWKDTQ